MTEPISFGNVLIVDHNQNDLFDFGNDSVTDEKSQPLSGTAEKTRLQAILKKIEAPNWKGVPLSMAAKLFNGLAKAELMSQQGYVLGTEMALSEAESGADGVVLNLKIARKQALIQTALHNGIAYRMREAKQDAQAGESVSTVIMHIDFADQYSARLFSEFNQTVKVDAKEVDSILKTAYPNRIKKLYADIDKSVNKGDIEMHRLRFGELTWTLTEAEKKYGFKLSRGDDAHLELEKKLYQNGIPYHYRLAKQDAADGDVFSAKVRLNRLRHYIQYSNHHFQTGFVFDEKKGDEILKTAYEKGARKALQEALTLAKKGSVDAAEAKLFESRSLTEEYNREIAKPKKLSPLAADKAFEKIVSDCYLRQICPK